MAQTIYVCRLCMNIFRIMITYHTRRSIVLLPKYKKKNLARLRLWHFTMLNQVAKSAPICNKLRYVNECCLGWLGFSACICHAQNMASHTEVEDTSLAKSSRKTCSLGRTATGIMETGIEGEYRLVLAMASEDGIWKFRGGVWVFDSALSECSILHSHGPEWTERLKM